MMGTIIAEVLVPARAGRALRVKQGLYLQVIDVKGGQVGDMTCVAADGSGQYLSPSHTIFCLKKLTLSTGDELFSDQRYPLMRIVKDMVGHHNLIGPCCDRRRYERDFSVSGHANCRDNLQAALRGFSEIAASIDTMHIFDAMHIFMNNCVGPDGKLIPARAQSKTGDYILFKASIDIVVAISACPQDLVPYNGVYHTPTELLMRVWDEEP